MQLPKRNIQVFHEFGQFGPVRVSQFHNTSAFFLSVWVPRLCVFGGCPKHMNDMDDEAVEKVQNSRRIAADCGILLGVQTQKM